MSSRNNPQSGHIVKAKALIVILEEAYYDAFNQLLEDGDCYALEQLCRDHRHDKCIPAPIQFFIPDDDYDLPDSMEQGEMYALFDENDIYEKMLTHRGEALERLGIRPKDRAWSVTA